MKKNVKRETNYNKKEYCLGNGYHYFNLENNGQIAFLDTLVSRRNGVIVIDVYRKPTHTDRYLDFSSHHDEKHKISTASTLLFRASSLPTSHEGKIRETSHVIAALEANGYPSSVISTILSRKPPSPTVPSPEELVSMFFKWVDRFGIMESNPEDAFKPEKRNTNQIWRIIQRAQMLRGKTTTPLTSITLVLLTKAITVFEKH